MTTVAAPVIEPHKVELVLRQLDGLPPLPSIVTRMLSCSDDSDDRGEDIVGLIEGDASLSARLLAWARRSGPAWVLLFLSAWTSKLLRN